MADSYKWDKHIASDWEWVGPPARPSLSELLRFDRHLDCLPTHSNAMILGSTVEFRDMCFLHRFDTTVVDYDSETFHILSSHLRHPNTAKLVEQDWREMTFSKAFDIVLGDLALNTLSIPDQRAVIARVAASLKPGGTFIHRTWVRDSLSDALATRRIDELVAEHERMRSNLSYFYSLAMPFLHRSYSEAGNTIDPQRLLGELRKAHEQEIVSSELVEEFEHAWSRYYMPNWIPRSREFEQMLRVHFSELGTDYGEDPYSHCCPIYVLGLSVLSGDERLQYIARKGRDMQGTRFRPSTIQIVGTVISITIGVAGGLLTYKSYPTNAVANGIALALVCEILTFVIDIYYGPLGESKRFQDALRASPVLKDYEDCIVDYSDLRRQYHGNGDMGQILIDWLDEKVQKHHSEAETDWKNGKLRFTQDELPIRTVRMQKCVRYGGFATQLERSTEFWERAEEYLKDTRELARQGKKIKRVFILNSKQSLQNAALRTQLLNDRSSGIETLAAYVSELSPAAIRDFGIWDEKVLCTVNMTPVGGYVTGCTYSMRDEDLERARRWRDEILRQAVDPDQVDPIASRDN